MNWLYIIAGCAAYLFMVGVTLHAAISRNSIRKDSVKPGNRSHDLANPDPVIGSAWCEAVLGGSPISTDISNNVHIDGVARGQ